MFGPVFGHFNLSPVVLKLFERNFDATTDNKHHLLRLASRSRIITPSYEEMSEELGVVRGRQCG